MRITAVHKAKRRDLALIVAIFLDLFLGAESLLSTSPIHTLMSMIPSHQCRSPMRPTCVHRRNISGEEGHRFRLDRMSSTGSGDDQTAGATQVKPQEKQLNTDDHRVLQNLKHVRIVEENGDDQNGTIKILSSADLRKRLRLSGRDKTARVFLPKDKRGSLEELSRGVRERIPVGDFPVAFYVKTKGMEGGRTLLGSDGDLVEALAWAKRKGLYLSVYVDVDPDFKEEEPPEWLRDIPNPREAEEWIMLSFYRFVEIQDPVGFAKMLQSAWSDLGVRGRIYVASEGVNAQMAIPCTVEHRFEQAVEAVDKLKGIYLNKDPRRWTREEFFLQSPFPEALNVRPRNQIVADGLEEPLKLWGGEGGGSTGRAMSPREWHEAVDSEDTIVLDCRNE
ncbi:unnamed protein product [Choristocarpus tenellus]